MDGAVEEYRRFLEEYLLPLLGIPKDMIKLEAYDGVQRINTFNAMRMGAYVVFLADKIPYFRIKVSISNDSLRLARNIIGSFLQVAKYKLLEKGTSIQHEYLSSILLKKSYEYSVQHGICSWITGSTQNVAIDRLLNVLERWSVQTYEGRKVTFGFVINRKQMGSIDWLEFLEDDYSATLTDCIHSVIELDQNGKLISHHSLTENGTKHSSDHGIRPYRFSDVLDNFVTQDKIGIFLLNNGDIIVSKAKQIRFVKRNLKWLNMSYEAFENAAKDEWISDTVIREIYASMLDVSFSHTGGIIAVVNKIDDLREKGILSPSDDITFSGDVDKALQDKISEDDLKKRRVKRRAILSLIRDCNFSDMDRKLRAELIAMDGACIISPEGKMLAVGAIIQNESGSSGGGRGAACKRLSQFGIAVKISTDGYIEMFKEGKQIYTVK